MTKLEKRLPGRPAYEPTDEARAKVRWMAGLRATRLVIARALGVSVDTIDKYYADEFVRGPQEADLEVATTVFYQATGRRIVVCDDGTEVVERCDPVPTAYIWWTKTQMGWKEQPTEHRITIDQQTPEQLESELEAIRSRKRIADREGAVAPAAEEELQGVLH